MSNWDLSNAQDVDYMFAECENLAKIDLRNWDLSNIKSIKRMFRDCSKLTDISTLSGWDTSNIENMWGLFD
ncbi:BspA family leucine-rich repeat surface protein [bacterium]|nr:BspA family leucine-rich repeat surface protein [bacterium]